MRVVSALLGCYVLVLVPIMRCYRWHSLLRTWADGGRDGSSMSLKSADVKGEAPVRGGKMWQLRQLKYVSFLSRSTMSYSKFFWIPVSCATTRFSNQRKTFISRRYFLKGYRLSHWGVGRASRPMNVKTATKSVTNGILDFNCTQFAELIPFFNKPWQVPLLNLYFKFVNQACTRPACSITSTVWVS